MSTSLKRAREDEEEAPQAQEAGMVSVGPAPPPPKKKKKKKTLKFEKLYLDSLPTAEMYEFSYMHRDVLSHVSVSTTDYIITGSVDGHIKFWKKQPEGILFVKHFRAHLAGIVDMRISPDGLNLVSVAADKSVKLFDVVGFDMISMFDVDFLPSCCCFVNSKGSLMTTIAIGSAETGKISIYDARGGGEVDRVVSLHSSPVVQIKHLVDKDVVISIDKKGIIEYWNGKDASFPVDEIKFRLKMETDLFDLAKSKAYPMSLDVCPKEQLFSVFGDDRYIRIFSFATGKLVRKINENLDIYNKAQADDEENPYKLEAFDFGKRMAVEKELDKYWAAARALPSPSSSDEKGKEGELEMDVSKLAALPNTVFDESGNFLLYPTMLGIKVFNIVTNKVVKLLGKVENIERFLRVALYQGKTLGSIAIPEEMQAEAKNDPHLVCTSHKRARFFLFTQREPAEKDGDDLYGVGRDILNERPPPDERSKMAHQPAVAQGTSAVIHTTMGDITVKLFPKECPKTVQNFTTHATNGYYNGIIFHRVIKGFMVQTGDPLGDGTGGTSIWGENFDDEFHRDLRHDRPFTVSMANAGPGTNGSQFFITTVPCPRLDNKHTVFGRVTSGMERVLDIEKVATDKHDKPYDDVKIVSITLNSPS